MPSQSIDLIDALGETHYFPAIQIQPKQLGWTEKCIPMHIGRCGRCVQLLFFKPEHISNKLMILRFSWFLTMRTIQPLAVTIIDFHQRPSGLLTRNQQKYSTEPQTSNANTALPPTTSLKITHSLEQIRRQVKENFEVRDDNKTWRSIMNNPECQQAMIHSTKFLRLSICVSYALYSSFTMYVIVL